MDRGVVELDHERRRAPIRLGDEGESEGIRENRDDDQEKCEKKYGNRSTASQPSGGFQYDLRCAYCPMIIPVYPLRIG